MRHGSLFSGIGGFDLAAQWMGWENVFQVEIDPFCQKVLEKNFPEVKRYGDIKEFNGDQYRGTIDVLTGGFPCQPYSSSGKRKGKNDQRHLWPEMLRVIREIQPAYIVAENVYGIVTWNKGLVFEQVQSEMEAEGYEVQSFIIPACGVDAPHERARVWFIAHSNSKHSSLPKLERRQDKTGNADTNRPIQCGTSSDTTGLRWIQSELHNAPEVIDQERERVSWERFPTQSPVRAGNDGVPSGLVRSAIHAAGNAIVPQNAFEIFKAIEQTHLAI